MSETIGTRVTERTVVVKDTIYICKSCGTEYGTERDAERCVRRHARAYPKYFIGDLVLYRCWPADHAEDWLGIIKEIIYDEDEIEYIVTNNWDNVRESRVLKLIKTKDQIEAERLEVEAVFNSLPKTMKWKMDWEPTSGKWQITGEVKK